VASKEGDAPGALVLRVFHLGGSSHVVLGSGIFVIALIAAVFGFGGIAIEAVGVAKILFFVFLILFIVSLLLGRSWRRPIV
jgi:uncharacterized membrane protein YtjA (UPF0391 family)